MLPPKIIQGLSVRDYAYQWIQGGCPIHRWCSGAIGITPELLEHVRGVRNAWYMHLVEIDMLKGLSSSTNNELTLDGLRELCEYIEANLGAPAEPYIPDQWGGLSRTSVSNTHTDLGDQSCEDLPV